MYFCRDLNFLQDPFRENGGVFNYSSLKLRLDAIKRKVDAEKASGNELDNLSSDEEEAPKPARPEDPPPEIDDWEEFLYGDDCD